MPFECKNCNRVSDKDELGIEDSPVGTCPSCGEHRFTEV